MAWIESHQSLSRHRKTIRTAGRLAVDRHKLIGHLHELWWWGLDNVGADGCLGDMEPFEIATAAEWDGDADAFVEALIEAGFIDKDEDGTLFLHDWHDYAGKLIEAREAERERSRRRRAEARERRKQEAKADGQQTTDGRPPADHRTTNKQPLAPYRTVPNRTVPKDDPPHSPTAGGVVDTDKVQNSKTPEPTNADPPFGDIIDHLNETAGKRFRASTEATKRHIRARWREGYRMQDFVEVIDKKTAQWAGDERMAGYLRPQTLFGTKFEAYLNEPWPIRGPVTTRASPDESQTSRLADQFRRKAEQIERGDVREGA